MFNLTITRSYDYLIGNIPGLPYKPTGFTLTCRDCNRTWRDLDAWLFPLPRTAEDWKQMRQRFIITSVKSAVCPCLKEAWDIAPVIALYPESCVFN